MKPWRILSCPVLACVLVTMGCGGGGAGDSAGELTFSSLQDLVEVTGCVKSGVSR